MKEFAVLDADRIYGFGGRFTYNFTDYLAVEAEGNYFPEANFALERRIMQALFGAKVGIRRKNIGVFGKARPGFLHLRDRLFCVIGPCTPPLTQPFTSNFEFAVDLGGVVEFYPTRAISLRVDIGDTIVRFERGVLFTPPPPSRVYFTSHNLQFSSGVGFRF